MEPRRSGPARSRNPTIEGLGGMAVSNGYLYAATTTGAKIYKIQTP
jgi:hypothetical protein